MGESDATCGLGILNRQAARLLEVERPVGAEDGGPRPVTQKLKKVKKDRK